MAELEYDISKKFAKFVHEREKTGIPYYIYMLKPLPEYIFPNEMALEKLLPVEKGENDIEHPPALKEFLSSFKLSKNANIEIMMALMYLRKLRVDNYNFDTHGMVITVGDIRKIRENNLLDKIDFDDPASTSNQKARAEICKRLFR